MKMLNVISIKLKLNINPYLLIIKLINKLMIIYAKLEIIFTININY